MKLIECPRDAMQGMGDYIPARVKAEYINLLLGVGFDTIDFGSFVSAKAVPQMRDTAEVLSLLDLSKTRSTLLAIVANKRGIDEAVGYDEITYLGFPFSISETFQQRNTNSGINESFQTAGYLINSCEKNSKKPVIYLSMGFGNPYGDAWSAEIAAGWTEKLIGIGGGVISLSDTVGIATPAEIRSVFSLLMTSFPATEFGAHLHSTPESWLEKVQAAYEPGCRRFDSAVGGYGGCPMAADNLTGNIDTEKLISYMRERGEDTGLDVENFIRAVKLSEQIFI